MQQKRYHLIVDLSEVPRQKLSDEAGLTQFLQKLPTVINMHVLKGPEIAVGIPENPGITGFVIIDYSHISVHTFSEYREALVDIFSCKPFDQEQAVTAVLEYFAVSKDQAMLKEVAWG